MKLAAALLLASVSPVFAQQSVFVPAAPIDLSGYVTATALDAAAASNLAIMQTYIPPQCSSVAVPDTLNGTIGSANCYVPRDAARPTVVQSTNITTDASGLWSVTWARSFTSSTPTINVIPVNSGGNPIICNVTSRSTTTAAGKCWQTNQQASALLSLTILVANTNASAVSAMVFAREPTQ